jgi:hypothetical protein
MSLFSLSRPSELFQVERKTENAVEMNTQAGSFGLCVVMLIWGLGHRVPMAAAHV